MCKLSQIVNILVVFIWETGILFIYKPLSGLCEPGPLKQGVLLIADKGIS